MKLETEISKNKNPELMLVLAVDSILKRWIFFLLLAVDFLLKINQIHRLKTLQYKRLRGWILAPKNRWILVFSNPPLKDELYKRV